MSFEFLYLDASGDEGWTPPDGRSQFRHFVLAGPVIAPDSDKAVGDFLSNVWDDVRQEAITGVKAEGVSTFPQAAAGAGKMAHFHMTAMLAGKIPPWRYIPKTRRVDFLHELIDGFLDLDLRFVGTVLDKTNHKASNDKRGTPAWDPFEYVTASTLGRFQRDLKASKGLGAVIMDSAGHQREKHIRQRYEDWALSGTTLSRNPRYPPITLDNVLNVVMFSPSRYVPGIQVADVAAASLFQKYERGDSSFFDRMKDSWKWASGTGKEPSVLGK